MAAERDRSWWRTQLQHIEHEGLTTKAYADREGIAVSSLYYWRKTFKEEQRRQKAHGNLMASPRFVAMTVRDVPTVAQAARCTLVLPSGMRLELAQLPAPEWLVALSEATTNWKRS